VVDQDVDEFFKGGMRKTAATTPGADHGVDAGQGG
jgi:hypothetical protein